MGGIGARTLHARAQDCFLRQNNFAGGFEENGAETPSVALFFFQIIFGRCSREFLDGAVESSF